MPRSPTRESKSRSKRDKPQDPSGTNTDKRENTALDPKKTAQNAMSLLLSAIHPADSLRDAMPIQKSLSLADIAKIHSERLTLIRKASTLSDARRAQEKT